MLVWHRLRQICQKPHCPRAERSENFTAQTKFSTARAKFSTARAENLTAQHFGGSKNIDMIKNIYLKCVLEPKLTTTDQNKFII